MEFAGLLTKLMDEQGVSVSALARKCYCDRSLLSRYKYGKQPPSIKIAQRCDEILNAGGALVEAARLSRRKALVAGGLLVGGLVSIAPETAERIAWAERHAPQADTAAVGALADVLAAQRRADDALGSAKLLRPAMAQLAAVENLVRQARGPVRPELVGVAEQWGQFCAWLAMDVGDTAAARSCCALAMEWAGEVGDKTMMSTVLAERSGMAIRAGEIGAAIGLAQGAQRDAAAATGQRAQAAGLEARAHALTGDAAAAERKLGDARDLASALADRPADRRPWSYWLTGEHFQNEAGVVCAYLAGNSVRWHERAVTLLKVPKDAPLWRSAENLAYTAVAHSKAGAVDQACAAAADAAPAVRLAGSVRMAGMLSQVHADLSAKYPGDSRVQQLADALA